MPSFAQVELTGTKLFGELPNIIGSPWDKIEFAASSDRKYCRPTSSYGAHPYVTGKTDPDWDVFPLCDTTCFPFLPDYLPSSLRMDCAAAEAEFVEVTDGTFVTRSFAYATTAEQKALLNANFNPDSGNYFKQCCAATCGSFTCNGSYTRASGVDDNTACDSVPCLQSKCCHITCASTTTLCTGDFPNQVANPEGIVCANDDCSDQTCCEAIIAPLPVCSTFTGTCADGFYVRDGDAICNDVDCTNGAGCCVANDVCSADAGLCQVNTHMSASDGNRACAAMIMVGEVWQCDDQICCTANLTCQEWNQCDVDRHLDPLRLTDQCGGAACDEGYCCDPNDTCADYGDATCVSGESKSSPESVTCRRMVCDDMDCCAAPSQPAPSLPRAATMSTSQQVIVAALSVSPSASASQDDVQDRSNAADETSGTPVPALLIAGIFGFVLMFAFLAYRIRRRLHQSLNLENRATAADAQLAAEPRLSISHHASMSLRMSRLDNVGDVESQREKSESHRLSTYSNARRKSEVAREDEVNRDIDAEVKRKKDARKQRKKERRRASMISGAGSRSADSKAEISGSGSGSEVSDIF
jgi:hypothetical protein